MILPFCFLFPDTRPGQSTPACPVTDSRLVSSFTFCFLVFSVSLAITQFLLVSLQISPAFINSCSRRSSPPKLICICVYVYTSLGTSHATRGHQSHPVKEHDQGEATGGSGVMTSTHHNRITSSTHYVLFSLLSRAAEHRDQPALPPLLLVPALF